MEEKKKIRFIVNPISGIKAKMAAIDLLKEELSNNFEYEVIHTKAANHATELAKEAVLLNSDAVIAVGGDGSVNEVGKALIHTDVPLGVIPFGSGNGFARHLKIPMQVKGAIDVINRFNVKRIDTAVINDQVFLATAGLGFDAHIGWKFADFGKRGFISYSQITINEYFNFQPETYEMIIDGEKIKTEAFLVNFANVGQYGNNAWIAPSASLTNGKLNVCILKPFPAHLAPDIIFKLFNKTIENSKYYQFFQAKEIEVINTGKFHIDGEPKESKEKMIIKAIPNSLSVIC